MRSETEVWKWAIYELASSSAWKPNFKCNLELLQLTIGHVRIEREQKNKDETTGTNLHFSFFVKRKLQTSPLRLVAVLFFLHKWKVAYYSYFET